METGGNLGNRHALVDDQPRNLEPCTRSEGSVSVGHESLLSVVRNLQQFHATAGGSPMSLRRADHMHSTNLSGQYT